MLDNTQVTLSTQLSRFNGLTSQLGNLKLGDYKSSERHLDYFAALYGVDLEFVKKDLLKVSDIQGAVKVIQDKPTQEVDLIVLHNTYAHLTALSGCIYTKPEEFDPVHTLACINDCLVFILVMQELHSC